MNLRLSLCTTALPAWSFRSLRLGRTGRRYDVSLGYVLLRIQRGGGR